MNSFIQRIKDLSHLWAGVAEIEDYMERFFADDKVWEMKKDFENEEQFKARLTRAFAAEYALADWLGDKFYTSRSTDTRDWESFSWDVLDPQTGARIEVKCTNSKNKESSMTFASSEQGTKFFYKNDINRIPNVIQVTNFVSPQSKADILVVVNFEGIDDGCYVFDIKLVITRATLLNAYQSGTTLLYTKGFGHGLYMWPNSEEFDIPAFMEGSVFIPSKKINFIN